MVKVNTENILFICGGAFDGIEQIIAKRINTQVIGFNHEAKDRVNGENLLSYITHVDIRHFGLIPELIGRLPVLAYLDPLDVDVLKRILVEPKNALLRQYQKLFEQEGVQLSIADDAVEFIAEKALEFKLGARGLRSICEAIMTDAMFEIPGEKNIEELVITRQYAEEKLSRSRVSASLKAA